MVNLRDLPIAHVCWVGKKITLGLELETQQLVKMYGFIPFSPIIMVQWKVTLNERNYIYVILEIHQFSTEP